MSNLAIHGGPKAVTARPEPIAAVDSAELKAELCRLVDEGVFSDASDNGVIGQFERTFADFTGCAHGLSFCNGTSALLAAYHAVGVGPGAEVIHPCYSWVASIAPVLLLGARPVFCGIDPDSLLIDPGEIDRLISPRTRALSVVHMHGNVCRMDAVLAAARSHGLAVIEDCSHCHGADYDGKRCGAIGDIGCFSMQGAPIGGKPIPCGEGGIAVCRSRDLYESMLAYAHINRMPTDGFSDQQLNAFAPHNRGMKFRAHPWAIACAALALRDLDRMNRMKLGVREHVLRNLPGIDALKPALSAPGSTPGGFYGGINLIYEPDGAAGVPTSAVLAALKAEGVACGPAPYPLLHKLPLFREERLPGSLAQAESGASVGDRLRPSEQVHARVINVLYPMHISAEQPYVTQVIAAFGKVFGYIRQQRTLSADKACS